MEASYPLEAFTDAISNGSYPALPSTMNPLTSDVTTRTTQCVSTLPIAASYAAFSQCYQNSGNVAKCQDSTGYTDTLKAYQDCLAGVVSNSTTTTPFPSGGSTLSADTASAETTVTSNAWLISNFVINALSLLLGIVSLVLLYFFKK